MSGHTFFQIFSTGGLMFSFSSFFPSQAHSFSPYFHSDRISLFFSDWEAESVYLGSTKREGKKGEKEAWQWIIVGEMGGRVVGEKCVSKKRDSCFLKNESKNCSLPQEKKSVWEMYFFNVLWSLWTEVLSVWETQKCDETEIFLIVWKEKFVSAKSLGALTKYFASKCNISSNHLFWYLFCYEFCFDSWNIPNQFSSLSVFFAWRLRFPFLPPLSNLYLVKEGKGKGEWRAPPDSPPFWDQRQNWTQPHVARVGE